MAAVFEAGVSLRPAGAVVWWRRWPLLLVLGVVVPLSLPQLMYPMGWDQATYGYYAQEVLRGAVPYRDFWEINGPGNFALYALVGLLLGPTPFTVNLLAIAETLLTTALLYRLAAQWLGRRYAVATALIYGVSCQLGFDYWARAEPETLIGLLQVIMLLLVTAGWRGSWLSQVAAGVIAGLAVTVKPTAGVLLPIAVACWFLVSPVPTWSGGMWLIARLGAGSAVVLLATAGLLHTNGALAPFIDQWQSYNGEYVKSWFSIGVVVVIRGLQSFLFVGPTPLLAVIGAVTIVRQGLSRSVHTFLVVWAALAMLAVVAQGFRHDYHYNMVFPAASLLAAHLLLSTPWRALWPPGAMKRVAVCGMPIIYLLLMAVGNPVRVAALGLAPLASIGVLPADAYRTAFNWRGHHTASRQALVDYLVCHTDAGASVYVVGEPAAYFLANVRSPIRFYHEVPLRYTTDPTSVLAEYQRQLEAAPPPQFIAFHDSPMDFYVPQRRALQSMLAPLLAEEYLPAYTADRVQVFRHKGTKGGLSARCGVAPS